MRDNEYEFDAMRQDAIRQAREMFRRSSPAEPDTQTGEDDDAPGITLPVKEKPRSQRAAPAFAAAAKAGTMPSGMFGSIFKDKDTALLLAVIILLFSDGGDRLLILALIYIMS